MSNLDRDDLSQKLLTKLYNNNLLFLKYSLDDSYVSDEVIMERHLLLTEILKLKRNFE